MYESHWKLARKPFENTPDAAFYYPSEPHQSALLKLRYVIENQRGAAVLCGTGGVGKTMLVRTLLQSLPDSFAPRVHIVFPRMSSDDLLGYIADELTGIPQTGTPQADVQRIQAMLVASAAAGQHPVVAIDEAQILADAGSLELIRLLLNFETPSGTGLTLLLTGQGELLPAIERIPSLEERLAVKCVLRAFTAEETASYISHRIQAAGGNHTVFTSGAMDAIHHASAGIPRRINRLCELALLVSYAEQIELVDVEQIEGVAEELLQIAPD